MKAADWIVDYLIKQGVTDAFGIPGAVMLELLYAFENRKRELTPHLCFHEQGAAFAACGYAQCGGKLGVAYSTRGPGFTNMITAIADAYYDSVPVLFITAHSTLDGNPNMRVMNNQEIDSVRLTENITKRSIRIDSIETLQYDMASLCHEAMSGRKGPVFIDIYSRLFSMEVDEKFLYNSNNSQNIFDTTVFESELELSLANSKRPILLIGNGVRDVMCIDVLKIISDSYSIPILSSRTSLDIIPFGKNYYGFVGSRANRYSNFILSKADLIISIGNRLAFPVNSKSFSPIVNKAKILRVDIDSSEFERKIANSICFQIDAKAALETARLVFQKFSFGDWIAVCDKLKTKLNYWDKKEIIQSVMDVMSLSGDSATFVCDVGNHGFWVSTAYSYMDTDNRILYSGSFGTLGCSLPKAIGAYYSSKKKVFCFTGDQGLQFNIQELQYLSANRIPLTIVILNNHSSGMIMEREKVKYGENYVHTNVDSGYSFPDFEKVVSAYGIDYKKVYAGDDLRDLECLDGPLVIEIVVDENVGLEPSLPIGKPCQDLSPELPRDLYSILDML